MLLKDRKRQMNTLVEELTKDKPDLSLVKTTMETLNLKYSDDPVERLNTVLMSFHPQLNEHEVLKDL